jgi:phospholipid/cholesterol/gamma-HCH transport system substrate-binding protein
MEPEVRYTLVGLALVVLVTAMVLGMIWLARTGARADFNFYRVYFQKQSLEGLQVGGDVNMRGIKVGRVEDYGLTKGSTNRVGVTIRVDKNAPVTEKTQATISRSFVTGIARINLETPDPPGEPLIAAAEGERYPVIPEGPSDIAQFTDTATKLADTASETFESLNKALSPENRAALAAALVNMRDLTAGLNARLDRLDRASDAIDRASRDFGTSAKKVGAAADRLANDFGPVAKQTEATLAELNTAVRAIQKDASALARRIDDVADSTGIEVRVMSQQIRASADLLAGALDRLQDPRATLLGAPAGALGPGEGR